MFIMERGKGVDIVVINLVVLVFSTQSNTAQKD